MTHPTTAYAEQVVAGEIVTGSPVRWSCERHLADLERDDVTFSEEYADHALAFFGLLHHYEGTWATPTLVLEPWQQFVLGSIFGWLREDGRRRFRWVWIEVARKNGKSFIASGVGLYLLLADFEKGAQVYTAATKREQARIIHRGAIAMRDKSPEIRASVEKVRDRLFIPDTNSFFAPLGADAKTEDGLNPHGVLVDEIHAHADGKMWDVLASALGSRSVTGQPLFFSVTTAGFGLGFGKQQHDYYRRLSDPDSGVDRDDVFTYVAELDHAGVDPEKQDDPYDPAVWIKANPNLGISVAVDYLESQATEARQNPNRENNFLCKNLNVWTNQVTRWISMDKWDQCAGEVDITSLRGERCIAGLDLAKTRDVTALVLFFYDVYPHPIVPYFWIPEDNIEERSKRDGVPYAEWMRRGLVRATPGDTTDYNFIKRDILEEISPLFVVDQWAFDRKFAVALVTDLMDEDLTMVPFGQGFYSMGPPTIELDRLVTSGGLAHGGNPVLRWMAGNVAASFDPTGVPKPDKQKSAEKIDGIVALCMAIGRSPLIVRAEPPGYNDGRQLVVI